MEYSNWENNIAGIIVQLHIEKKIKRSDKDTV